MVIEGATNALSPVEWILTAVDSGKARLIRGTRQDLEGFFGFFEPWPGCEPPLTVPRR